MPETGNINVEVHQTKSSKTASIESVGSFETFLGQEVRLLRLSGLSSMNSVFTGDIKRAKNWEAWPFVIGVIFYVFLSLCQLFTVFKFAEDDPNFAVQVFTSLLTIVHCTIKGLRLYFWRRELYGLLRGFAVLWGELHLPIVFKNEISESARETYLLIKYYCFITVALVTTYGSEPYIRLLRHHLSKTLRNNSFDYNLAIIPTTYPFSIQTFMRYINCILWEQCILVYFVLWSVSTDGLFAQLTTHTAIHFRVLCHDLKSIVIPTEDDNINHGKNLIHQLSNIVKRHQDLYMYPDFSQFQAATLICLRLHVYHGYCNIIETMFNPIIFVLMLMTAASMCCFVFQLEKEISEGHWAEAIKYLVGVAYSIVQAFIYCSHAEILTQQSGQLVHAAYNCQWIHSDKHFKALLLIIMMRSQREFLCTAYGIFSVSLNQITTITKTAASYFTLLKSMA